MSIITTTFLESNKRIKINFKGGNLSSNSGLLLIREFAVKAGLINLVKRIFKPTEISEEPILMQTICSRWSSRSLPLTSKTTVRINWKKSWFSGDSPEGIPGFTVYSIPVLEPHGWTFLRQLDQIGQTMQDTVDTIRLKLLKVAARVIRSAGYITFKLCSSCPYKEEFFETLLQLLLVLFSLLLTR